MPTYDELTNAFDQAWKAHDYGFALTCISELLHRYHGSVGQLGLAIGLVYAPVYTNLAAAFGADDVLKAMDRVARRIASKNDPRCKNVNPEESAEHRSETLSAMQRMRSIVEQAGSIESKEFIRLATRERITKVKSRLNWMVKAGTVHLIDEVVHWGRGPNPSFTPMGSHIGEVPKLRAYVSSEWDMNATQLEFYRKFETRYRAGEHVELEGQWSYGFALLYKLEEEYSDDLAELRVLHERFENEYPGSPLLDYFSPEGPDLFETGEWQAGVDQMMPYLPMDIYLTLASVVSDTRLQVATVDYWTTQHRTVTTAFRKRKSEVQLALQDLLDAAHDQLGRSIVEDLWKRLVVDRQSGELGPEIADEFGGYITQDELNSYLEYHDRALAPTWAYPLESSDPPDPPDSSDSPEWPVPFCYTYWFEQIVRARIQALYRDAENIARANAGMPSVGEGWVSEVLLLRSLREEFPQEKIVHQGRPDWLGKQSLDIYLPDHNVGIEYQGAQHSGPVAIFGGELAYERQLERDSRKKRLCLINGCLLIEVHPGYDLNSVLCDIKEAMERQRQ